MISSDLKPQIIVDICHFWFPLSYILFNWVYTIMKSFVPVFFQLPNSFYDSSMLVYAMLIISPFIIVLHCVGVCVCVCYDMHHAQYIYLNTCLLLDGYLCYLCLSTCYKYNSCKMFTHKMLCRHVLLFLLCKYLRGISVWPSNQNVFHNGWLIWQSCQQCAR